MFCRNCGNSLPPDSTFCNTCGISVNLGKRHCPNCANETSETAVVCVKCGYPLSDNAGHQTAYTSSSTPASQPKSRIAAGLLGVLLGSLGLHNFYLGYTQKGIIQILLCTVGSLLTCGAGSIAAAIWGLVEGIMILSGSVNTDASGIPLKD